MRNRTLKALARLVSAGLTIGVLYFAYVYGKKLIGSIQFDALEGNYWFLILSFLCFLAFYSILSIHWLLICRLVQRDTSNTQVGSFFASQPYKYLPTSLFTFSFRAKFAKQLGMPLRSSTYAQLLENLNIIGGGLLVGAVFYLLDENYLYAAAFLGVIVSSLVFLRRQKVVLTIPKIHKALPLYSMVVPLVVVCLAWVAGGISFILVNYSLGISPNIWMALAANALGYALSILAVFAPGGIGVREFVLVSLGIQNSAVVMWRILTFVADLLVGFGALAALKFMRRRK